MSTSTVQVDGQVMVEATSKPSCILVVTQAMPVATGPRNTTSGGPVLSAESVRQQPIGPKAFVVHGVPIQIFVDEICWQAYKWRLGVSEWVIRARWLVALDRRRSQAASSLVLYYNGVVSVHLRVLRFGGH